MRRAELAASSSAIWLALRTVVSVSGRHVPWWGKEVGEEMVKGVERKGQGDSRRRLRCLTLFFSRLTSSFVFSSSPEA